MRRLIAAAWLALGCQPDGEIPLAMCPDDGSCFDGVDASPAVDFGRFDFRRPDPGRFDAGQPDAAVDATPDAMLDTMVDATTDATLDATTDATFDAMPDATPDADATPDPDAATDAGVDPAPSCAARGLAECFGHPDCPAAERCEDVGDGGVPVPCCVPGARGALPAGADCADVDGQIACASGVCIEGDDAALCSAPCDSPADCPPALPRCLAFPFGATAYDWCFPQ